MGMLTVTSEDARWSTRNVKFDIIDSYTMRLLFLMFVTAVCVIPFKSEMTKNREHLGFTLIPQKVTL